MSFKSNLFQDREPGTMGLGETPKPKLEPAPPQGGSDPGKEATSGSLPWKSNSKSK